MVFQILTLVLIACCLLYYYFQRKLNYFKDLGIPYVSPVPLFGNLGEAILRRKHITVIVRDIYNFNPEAKYVGAFDFMKPVIVLRDPELIKSIAIKNFNNFMDNRPLLSIGNDPLFDNNLINLTGERWRESRNFLSPVFTSSKLKGMFKLMVEVGENFTNHMTLQVEDPNNVLNMKDLFTRFTNDVIATCAFGINVDSLKNPNNEFYLMGRKATNLEGFVTVKFFFGRVFPNLMKMLNVKFMDDEVKQYYIDMVSTTIATRKEKGIFRPDMLQLMMEAEEEQENGKIKLDMMELTALAFTFYFAGFDSTSTLMCFVTHELATNPDTQKRLQDEIDEVLININGEPTYDTINSMHYLDAVIKETLRHHSPGPFLNRVCTKPFELPPALPECKPFTVKPDMDIWLPVAGIHMDPNYYENPKKFDPDRYYEKSTSLNDMHSLGFGIGPRGCIGNRFATLEVKLILFYLFAKFNLKPNAKTSIPLEYSLKSFILTAKDGFWLSAELRNNENL